MVSNRHLAKYNIKFIQYSFYVLILGVIAFFSNVVFYPPIYKAIIIGISVGILWGIFMPIVWKKESEILNMIIAFSIIPISGYLSEKYGLFASFQMFSIVLLVSGLFWCIQKDKLLKYLSE